MQNAYLKLNESVFLLLTCVGAGSNLTVTNQAPAAQVLGKCGGVYNRCFLVKACPEPCFRYFSNVRAIFLFGNPQNHFRKYGRFECEYLDLPLLCSARRFLTSEVEPMYKLESLALCKI